MGPKNVKKSPSLAFANGPPRPAWERCVLTRVVPPHRQMTIVVDVVREEM
jgi:hypothetical protein